MAGKNSHETEFRAISVLHVHVNFEAFHFGHGLLEDTEQTDTESVVSTIPSWGWVATVGPSARG